MKEWIIRRSPGGSWYVSQSHKKPGVNELRLVESEASDGICPVCVSDKSLYPKSKSGQWWWDSCSSCGQVEMLLRRSEMTTKKPVDRDA